MAQKAFLARRDQDYEKLNITKDVQLWEDGLRTSGKEGSYEWWYFDAEYEDGTKAALIFYTKKFFDVKGAAQPLVKLDVSKNGEKVAVASVLGQAGEVINSSIEKCHIQIKNCFAKHNQDGTYTVHFESEDKSLIYDLLMKPRLPMWRPGTGHIFFGDKQEHYFAWLVGAPSADLEATLTYNGNTYNLKGNGYHDHNWGNIMMTKLMNHWYWCRVAVEDYTAITCDIVAEKKYGYTRLPIFMLGKDGKIIEDDERYVEIDRLDTIQLNSIGKFMDNKLKFTHKKDGIKYIVEYNRDHDIDAGSNLKTLGLSNFLMKICKAIGINPTYARSVGKVNLTIYEKDKVQTFTSNGLWEQMGFGSEKNAILGNMYWDK